MKGDDNYIYLPMKNKVRTRVNKETFVVQRLNVWDLRPKWFNVDVDEAHQILNSEEFKDIAKHHEHGTIRKRIALLTQEIAALEELLK